MTATTSIHVNDLESLLDRDVGPSEWLTVDQRRIDDFAAVSGDHQWIHTDPERAAKESPYGATIAHGNLTLALIDGLRFKLVEVTGAALAVNYGWDRVRFPAPVISGQRIRASSRLQSLERLEGGWAHTVTRVTVEVEGGAKPCCVADSVIRYLAAS